MSAFAHRRNGPRGHEYEWLDFSKGIETSAASIWDADYEDDEITIQTRRDSAKAAERAATLNEVNETEIEIAPQVRILDESQVLPGEASFATVVLNREIPPPDFDAHEEVVASSFDESTVRKPDARVRILDETQVLPGEASFATVVLNQEIPPDFDVHDEAFASSFDESSVRNPDADVRVFDETDIVPGEASFAMIKNERAAGTYSPLEEFKAKFKLNWKSLSVGAVVLFSLSAGVTLAILHIAEANNLRSRSITSKPARPSETQAEARQPQTTATALRPAIVVSDKQKKAPTPVMSPPPVATKVETTRSEASNSKTTSPIVSENSRKTASEEIKSKVPNKTSRPEVKPVATVPAAKHAVTDKKRQTRAEDRIDRKKVAPKTQAKINDAGLKAKPRNQSSSVSRESTARQEVQPTSARSSSGAQRPRTVTRKDP